MNNISNLIDTGSGIMAGFSKHQADNRWRGFSHNWNLLLCLKGDAYLQFNGGYCTLPQHSLILISPDGIRNFTTEKDWEALWVHFDREIWFNDGIEWEEKIPGVWILPLTGADFRIMRHLFIQIVRTVANRERFWRRLLYCLIQEVILRGNMAFCRGTDYFDTALAHKMLSNLQENLSMDEIAARCGLSRTAFFSKFTAVFNVSPRKYRENHLMLTIQMLLETTDMSICDICRYVHMSTPFYLSARFKSYCGIPPSEYRKRFRTTINRNTGDLSGHQSLKTAAGR